MWLRRSLSRDVSQNYWRKMFSFCEFGDFLQYISWGVKNLKTVDMLIFAITDGSINIMFSMIEKGNIYKSNPNFRKNVIWKKSDILWKVSIPALFGKQINYSNFKLTKISTIQWNEIILHNGWTNITIFMNDYSLSF